MNGADSILNRNGKSRRFRAVDNIDLHISPVTSARSNHADASIFE